MHQTAAPVGDRARLRTGSSARPIDQLTTWLPEAIVVGASLTVVGLAVGAVSAGPAAAAIALFASAALWLNLGGDDEAG